MYERVAEVMFDLVHTLTEIKFNFIIQTAPTNRILDYSDDDDDNESDASSFELDQNSSGDSDEESDSSCDESPKPKSTQRKRNPFIFLDLTCNEVIEDEEHENPDATPDELERVGSSFLKSLQTETCVQTPAPVKKNVPTSTTKRKLFFPNYDDQTPFEEIERSETPIQSQNDENDKVIQLTTPIPSYLIPPQFREKARACVTPITSSKKIPQTPAPLPVCGFLESLDGIDDSNIFLRSTVNDFFRISFSKSNSH